MKGKAETIFLDSPVQFDSYRPRYHVQPHAGWLNDPNGPIYWKGHYHLFYQHLPEACEWDFGIVWGHSVSEDLLHWRPLPPALVPTPGGLDADGCFSGCCVTDPVSGVPTILYTGVRLRSNALSGPPPPAEHDLGLVWIESQMAAVPEDPDDPYLVKWTKHPQAFLPLPPAELQLTGWRDPFIYYANTLTPAGMGTEKGAHDLRTMEYRMLIGSGIKGLGGTALVYTSNRVDGGWQFRGTLCEGNAAETGFVWECPLIVPLTTDAAGEDAADALGLLPAAPGLPATPGPPHWLVGASAVPPPELAPSSSLGGSGGLGEGAADLGRPLGRARHRLSRRSADSDAVTSLSREDSFEFSAVGDGGSVARLSDLPRSPSVELWPSPRPPAAEEDADGAPPVRASTDASAEVSEEDDAVAELRAVGAARHGAVAPAVDSRHSLSAFESALGDVAQPPSPGAGNRPAPLGIDRAATLEIWNQGPTPFDAPAQPPASPDVPLAVRPRPLDGADRPRSGADSSDSSGSTPTIMASRDLARAPLAAGLPPGAVSVPSPDRNADRPPPAPTSTAPPLPPPTSTATPAGPADSRGRVLGLNLPAQARQQQREPSIDQFARFQQRVVSIRPRRTASVEQRLGRQRGSWADVSRSASRDPGPRRQWHLFSVSPDAPTNPVLFWMGHMAPDGMRFEIDSAKGPFRLDLGDILYAPNVLQDASGRWLLWGWLQEKRGVGSYDYAGCLTLPRELHATPDGRLIQAPLAELTRLRRGPPGVRLHNVTLSPAKALELEGVQGDCLDIVITLQRGRSYAAGLLFKSYEAGDDNGAALVYDWVTGRLEVVYGVPPNWTEAWLPQLSASVTPRSSADVGAPEPALSGWATGDESYVDPAMLLVTPRFSSQVSTPLGGGGAGPFSPDGGRFPAGGWTPPAEHSEAGSPTLLPLHLPGSGSGSFAGGAALVHATTAPTSALRKVSSIASGITHLGGGIRRSSTYLRLGALAGDDGNGPPELVDALADDALLEDLLGSGSRQASRPSSPREMIRRVHAPEEDHASPTRRGRHLARRSAEVPGAQAAGRLAGGILGAATAVVGSLPARTGGLVARGLFGRSSSREHSQPAREGSRPHVAVDTAPTREGSARRGALEALPSGVRRGGLDAGPARTPPEPVSPATSGAPSTTHFGGVSGGPPAGRPLSRTPSFLGPAAPAAGGETLEQLLEDLAGTAPEGGPSAAPPPELRRVGGPLAMRPTDTLHLRILLDHSSLEVFTGTGEVLSARVYRGSPPVGAGPGIELVAFGEGAAHLRLLEAFELFGLENAHTASVPLSPVVSPRAEGSAPATPGAGRHALFDHLVSGLEELNLKAGLDRDGPGAESHHH